VGLVRSVLPDAYAAKARGLVLCVMSIGAGYTYYLAFDTDSAIPPAAADAITLPPAVKAQPINAPVHVVPDDAQHQSPVTVTPDRAVLARALQSALTEARCYDGPINGEWTAASQQAARAFLAAVDGEMPVTDPEPALLSLVKAHARSTCPVEMPLYTGALVAAQESASPADERSMLDQPWASPEMLVPSKPPIPAAASQTSSITVISDAGPFEHDALPPSASPTASQELSSPVAPITPARLAASEPAPDFEGGKVLSDSKPDRSAQPPPARKVARHKTRSAKRRASRRHDDSSFGVSFDSIQESLSSLF
jgi:hypothetical protein